MLTAFAPPDRATTVELERQRRLLAADPLVWQLLAGYPGPAVILNEQRQIVSANRHMASLLETEPADLTGLRPGEAVGCVHAQTHAGVCGTSSFCRHCGAVNAILTSQRGMPDERECRISGGGEKGDYSLDLRVSATPLEFGGELYTIFAIRDISDEKRRAVLERLFFHDVLNTAGGLLGLLQLWPDLVEAEARDVAGMARLLSIELIEEIRSGRDLTAAERGELQVELRECDAEKILLDLCSLYTHHTVAEGRRLSLTAIEGDRVLISDATLLRRVLGNIIKNALEASAVGQTVTVSFAGGPEALFTIHNEAVMAEEVRAQLFQRSFSTKIGSGRGVGTYSVKLLTERYLKGTVNFTSTAGAGTTFYLRIPNRGIDR